MIHKTKDGKEMLLSEMTDAHLENTIKMIKRKAKEGITVCFGLISPDIEPDFHEEFIKGKDVAENFDLDEYEKEMKRRRK